MGLTLAQKIIKSHLVGGNMKAGEEIALHIDQTLTQDATGTMAYLEFEAMGIDRVRTEKSVAYIDHNTLQSGFEMHIPDVFREAKGAIIFREAGEGMQPGSGVVSATGIYIAMPLEEYEALIAEQKEAYDFGTALL